MVQSDCRELCDVWGGSVIKKMSFSFATMIAVIDKWGSYLFKIKGTGSSLPCISYAKNASNSQQCTSNLTKLLGLHLKLKL